MDQLTFQCSDCIFEDNSASADGGAVALISAGELVLSNSSFSGNESTAGSGGALLVQGKWTALVSALVVDCSFSDNHVAEEGGGISLGLTSGVDLTVQGSTFSDNSADLGGAVGISTQEDSVLLTETRPSPATAPSKAGASPSCPTRTTPGWSSGAPPAPTPPQPASVGACPCGAATPSASPSRIPRP